MPAETKTFTAWTIDATHSEIGFRVRHMMVSWTKGRFGAFSGTATLDDQHPERSRVEVTIDAASIHTGLAPRDEHLRSSDFLDVARHPHMTFRSTSVRRASGGGFTVQGDLSIRGVARPVTLEVEDLGETVADPWGGTRRGVQARARIDRKEFGLAWNSALEAGGVLVGDEVRIELEVELVAAGGEAKQAA